MARAAAGSATDHRPDGGGDGDDGASARATDDAPSPAASATATTAALARIGVIGQEFVEREQHVDVDVEELHTDAVGRGPAHDRVEGQGVGATRDRQRPGVIAVSIGSATSHRNAPPDADVARGRLGPWAVAPPPHLQVAAGAGLAAVMEPTFRPSHDVPG
jgi:hypothetical protein